MKYPILVIFLFFISLTNAQSEEINEVIEDFRLGILNLESEKEWSKLFLHDSITWAMVREGKTETERNNSNPNFRFFSSDPISFFRFLKGKNQKFEEKFYDVSISNTEKFATVEFLYSFNENGKILNWGKEYWSLLKVKGDWKITSVTWTENLQSIEQCPFSNMKSFSLKQYRCPPCPFGCDVEIHDNPGLCSVCKMELQEIKETKFGGYKKSTFYIKNDSIQLFAAYYLPEDVTKIKGGIVISHGSAPSTHEDVAYYTKLATQLNMAVLAYDKRGTGLSSGTYEYFTVDRSKEWFDMIASDLQVCFEWLRKRSELKDKEIGFFGGSQAGWIMPLAASRLESVDFIIIGEGAAVSAGEEAFHSNLTGDGSGNGISIDEADKKLKTYNGELGFDPRPILKNLNTKILWFFGTKDDVMPVNASIEVLNEINNKNYKIIILPNGDHNFKNVETGKRYDLIEYIEPWLKKIGILE
ncbi:alpha/beta hydrolase family protein [Pontimicrobium aquaticum]|nr:alpha/beta hydrolase [Pontimicrobium aquaticum]